MLDNFNYRPDNWKKADLKYFLDFITSYNFFVEYRQLYRNEDVPSKGILPTKFFHLKDKSAGVALVKYIENNSYEYFSFGKDLKQLQIENIAYNGR